MAAARLPDIRAIVVDDEKLMRALERGSRRRTKRVQRGVGGVRDCGLHGEKTEKLPVGIESHPLFQHLVDVEFVLDLIDEVDLIKVVAFRILGRAGPRNATGIEDHGRASDAAIRRIDLRRVIGNQRNKVAFGLALFEHTHSELALEGNRIPRAERFRLNVRLLDKGRGRSAGAKRYRLDMRHRPDGRCGVLDDRTCRGRVATAAKVRADGIVESDRRRHAAGLERFHSNTNLGDWSLHGLLLEVRMPRTPSRSNFETASATFASVVERGQFGNQVAYSSSRCRNNPLDSHLLHLH